MLKRYKNMKVPGTRITIQVHTSIASKALGRPLPENSEVHHVDGDKHNNRPENLVICPNRQYHMILHRRTKALLEGGNANFFRCRICHKWDEKENLNLRTYFQKGSNTLVVWHRECDNKQKRERRKDVQNAVV